jgi:NDP-sugar pyrophosphorylase family protein
MDKILICPSERAAVAFLAQTVPLVAVPILGEPLVNHWVEALAKTGAKDLLVLATDRPEVVRAAVGDGSRWGVRVQVRAQLKDPSPDEAAIQAGVGAERILMLDHLPGLPGQPLFHGYHPWVSAVLAWMPIAARFDRIGLRELQPQVWCGRRTHVAASARLHGPCWLGDHVRVGPNAVVGPGAILENGVVVDSAAEIRGSVVGPDTLVGSLTTIEESIAWGNTLINCRSGSCTQVPDPFLLCALGQRYLPQSGRSVLRWLRSGVSALLARS